MKQMELKRMEMVEGGAISTDEVCAAIVVLTIVSLNPYLAIATGACLMQGDTPN